MKHRVVGRKLGRTSAHRLALLRNLSTSLFHYERIKTTLMKAKELRPFAEKLLTLSKRETLHARRQVLRHIHDGAVVSKMFDTLSARYAQRPGGYTRIIKLGPRRGDSAEMAIVELVDFEPVKTADKGEDKDRGKGGRKAKGEAAEAAPESGKRRGRAKEAEASAAGGEKKARARGAKRTAKPESAPADKTGRKAATRKGASRSK